MKDSVSYRLPSETLPGLSMENHLKDIVEFRKFIESKGIVTDNTRIDRYFKCLQCIVAGGYNRAHLIFKNQPTDSFSEFGECLMYLLREIHELMWILKGLKISEPIGIDDKLRTIISGSDFAAIDGNSESRNTQFELRIASYFCQSGYRVDLTQITDVVATGEKAVFYVECKRVGSPKQLQKRISEAKRQLQLRMPKKSIGKLSVGIVAIDVTSIAFPHNGMTWAMTNDHSRDLIQKKLIDISETINSENIFVAAGSVIDCWFQIHIPALIFYPRMVATRFSSLHIFRSDLNRKMHRAVSTFMNLFEHASKGDVREVPPQKIIPRKTLDFPSGTEFEFDEEILAGFLAGDIPEKEMEFIVGELKINGKNYCFTFFEFTLIASRISQGEVDDLKKYPVKARLVLLGLMWNFREPQIVP